VISSPELNIRLTFVWATHLPVDDAAVGIIKGAVSRGRKATILCGGDACMQEVKQLNFAQVTATRIRIRELLRATPFSGYLKVLPILPLYFGPAFPSHFERFCAYVGLWRDGGLYISLRSELGSDALGGGCHSEALEIAAPPTGQRYAPHSSEIEKLLLEFITNAVIAFELEGRQGKQSTLGSVWQSGSAARNSFGVATFNNQLRQHYGVLRRSDDEDGADFSSEINVLAALQFLPFVDTFVEKDTWRLSGPCIDQNDTRVRLRRHSSRVTFLMDQFRITENTDWPPADVLNPLIISMHTGSLQSTSTSAGRGRAYLKSHGAVGSLNSSDVVSLTKHEVVAYLSAGSSVLMNRYVDGARSMSNKTYFVGVEPSVAKSLMPSQLLKEAVHMQTSAATAGFNRAHRFVKANLLLHNLSTANVVVTNDLNWALPCAGMGVPVVFLRLEGSYVPSSLEFALKLFHVVNVSTSGVPSQLPMSFSWDSPLPNPNPGLLYRLQASAWEHIRQDVGLRETARTYGIVPLREKNSTGRLQFFQVYTSSSMNVRNRRSLESILYHHPESPVTLLSNTLHYDEIAYYTELGYDVRIVPYSLTDLLTQAIDSEKGNIKMFASAFARRLSLVATGEFWYSHETDLIRLLIIYMEGGVYLDTDVIVLRQMSWLKNVLATQEDDYSTLNGAVLAFEAKNLFLLECIREFLMAYNGKAWAENGPELLTRVAQRGNLACKNTDPEPFVQSRCHVSVLKKGYFYPIGWGEVESACFTDTNPETTNATLKYISDMAYTIHLNNRITGRHGRTIPGTVCRTVLNKFCIACSSLV
jgi:Alpha 1,4-glycosyltransferase conserved region/Glycosyltransferase sugar-binding region containing DXD motif